MRIPTPEQEAVLNSQDRIKIVKAVPGAGKTWLVAELIKRELTENKTPFRLAALSFTRVGGEEIRKAMGYEIDAPHFVGTLDAFCFKYIVRPFLKLIFPKLAHPRLIPAEWEPNLWKERKNGINFRVEIEKKEFVNLFSATFIGEDEKDKSPIFSYKKRHTGLIVQLAKSSCDKIMEAKNKLWEKYGWLTHSDAAFLASKILGNKQYGLIIRTELIKKFSYIIVDELQDTSWFLGKSIFQMLSDTSVKGVLVGDPDQAIYEFNGARPDFFDRFIKLQDSRIFYLSNTRRCNAAACKVAKNFISLQQNFIPASQKGRAFLLSYNKIDSDIQKIQKLLQNYAGIKNMKIVARHTKTIEKITNFFVKKLPKLSSPFFNHLHQAVNNFRRGHQTKALTTVQVALKKEVFGYDMALDTELVEKGINLNVWKSICAEILLQANLEKKDETFEKWGERLKKYIKEAFSKIISVEISPRMPGGDNKTKLRHPYLVPIRTDAFQGKIPVQTVHSVKGETHDLTVFVCSDSSSKDECPSIVWWNDENREERRIAFVAVTRTRGNLIVCVSKDSMLRLQETRPSFTQSFDECMSIDEFINRVDSHAKAESDFLPTQIVETV